jgi:predicted transcriptional regulator
MTKEQIEAIFERVRAWPAEKQEEAASILLALEAEPDDVYVLSEEERADVEAGLEEARQGKFASDEEVKALFDRYRIR